MEGGKNYGLVIENRNEKSASSKNQNIRSGCFKILDSDGLHARQFVKFVSLSPCPCGGEFLPSDSDSEHRFSTDGKAGL